MEKKNVFTYTWEKKKTKTAVLVMQFSISFKKAFQHWQKAAVM